MRIWRRAVARPDAGDQAEGGAVGDARRRRPRRRRASPPAPGRRSLPAPGGASPARRAAASAPGRSRSAARLVDDAALRRHRDAVVLRLAQVVPRRAALARPDQRADVEVGQRRADAQRAIALADARQQLVVDRSARPAARLPAEQVWPAFWMMALTRTGSAASRSASSKTICGDLAAEFERDRAVVLGRRLLRPRVPTPASR